MGFNSGFKGLIGISTYLEIALAEQVAEGQL